uniref:Uncharacterized protein n=1 Tax=Avena sativa TaxID=4498 RepID=A0ACD6A6F1_AVESA
MPELPEVEAARRALEAHCVGRRIARCAVADDPKVVLTDRVAFERSMVGRTIVAARRRGKNLWLSLDAPPFPSFQFGMAGAIYIKGVAVTKYKRSAVKSTDEWPSKYSKFFVELDDGLEFSFTDKRRFARVRLFDDPETVPPISELGPDALFEPMSIQNFVDSLSKKKIGIKALLLDQSFISGIGNWIADEVLYQPRKRVEISRAGRGKPPSRKTNPVQVSEDGAAKEAGEDGDDNDDDLKPRKRVAISTAGRGKPPSRKTNSVQVSEDGGAKEVVADGDDLKPIKRMATSSAARGKQNKNATSAPSRKTGKVAGGKKKPSIEHGGKDDVETMEPNKASATSNDEPGLDKPTAAVHGVSDRGVTRTSSRKKSKPTKYQ